MFYISLKPLCSSFTHKTESIKLYQWPSQTKTIPFHIDISGIALYLESSR